MTTATLARNGGQATLTVSELAHRTGVAPSAIRFYEKHRLVVSERTAGNQRRFYEAEECIVKIIRVAQRVGLSIAEIRELMADLPERRRITIDDWCVLRRALESEVRARLQALHAALDDLTSDQRLCEIPPATTHRGQH
ncbi:MerR family transcriptional regulator [Actinocatenispora sera]|uniref:HTH merR-type domain-containing protein n=1 Tax=Actinocatenispora sera TaxID=390989 RepID=A0A810L1Z6_9ACTN|nr:MerR family transcriptional regulator [Actinocatenispora sera]BCJ28672.1 hypothetical protein Asera_27800 [Actinocatenispora sera]